MDEDSSSHSEELVPVGELPQELTIGLRVSLSPAELTERFASDERIDWSGTDRPDPFPDSSAPQFQAWQWNDESLFIRHSVPAAVNLSSPCVFIEWEPTERGTKVRIRFLRHPPRSKKSVRNIQLAMAVWIVVNGGYLLIGEFLQFAMGIIGAVAALLVLALIRNRPKPASMEAYGGDLRRMIGEALVPHQLGDGDDDDPFRNRGP